MNLEYPINKKEISEAIFNYIRDKKKLVPNRKRGVKYENKWGNLIAWIEIK